MTAAGQKAGWRHASPAGRQTAKLLFQSDQQVPMLWGKCSQLRILTSGSSYQNSLPWTFGMSLKTAFLIFLSVWDKEKQKHTSPLPTKSQNFIAFPKTHLQNVFSQMRVFWEVFISSFTVKTSFVASTQERRVQCFRGFQSICPAAYSQCHLPPQTRLAGFFLFCSYLLLRWSARCIAVPLPCHHEVTVSPVCVPREMHPSPTPPFCMVKECVPSALRKACRARRGPGRPASP